MLQVSDFWKRDDCVKDTDCTDLLSPWEIQLVTKKIQQDFIDKVTWVVQEILQWDISEIQKRLTLILWESKSINSALDLAFECPEIRRAMEWFSSDISKIILETGRIRWLWETDNHYGIYFKVIREALGEIFFDLAHNKDSQERLRNIHLDNESVRVKIKHNGKSKSENFNPQNYSGSKIKAFKAALRKRKDLTQEREKQIEGERKVLEAEAKKAEFDRKVYEAETQLFKEWIIEEIEVKKIVTRWTEKGKDGKDRSFIEEEVITAFKIKNLKIRVDNRGSSRYFHFEKSKNGQTKKAEKWLPQHNGKAFGMILEDIYHIYATLLGREFSVYERFVLSKLGELWKYDATR